MRKIISFMHVSLDGLVAGPNGEMNWIKTSEELFDYVSQRTNQADMAIYGRVTFEMMQNYWPTAASQPNATKHDKEHSSWYNTVNKIVLSKTMSEPPDSRTKILSTNIKAKIQDLQQTGEKEIILFGSPTALHSLIQWHLIDEYWLFVNPILLGKGIPLFPSLDTQEKLKLCHVKSFQSGVVCLHYEHMLT